MDIGFCNEILAYEGISFHNQCKVISELGYTGLELVPGTIGVRPHLLNSSKRENIKTVLNDYNLKMTALHCNIGSNKKYSIVDGKLTKQTLEIITRLIDLCSDLGGNVFIHGIRAQRQLLNGNSHKQNVKNVIEFFKPIVQYAELREITYCFEPLSIADTNFVNRIEEAAEIVDSVGSPFFKTMIDSGIAGKNEKKSVADLIRQWVPTGIIGHIHLNDSNGGAPGMGKDPFVDIIQSVIDVKWSSVVGIDPSRKLCSASIVAAIGKSTINAHLIGLRSRKKLIEMMDIEKTSLLDENFLNNNKHLMFN